MTLRVEHRLAKRNESFSSKQPDGLELLFISCGRKAVAEFAHAAIDAVPTSRLQLFITTSTNLINKWVNDLTDKVPA